MSISEDGPARRGFLFLVASVLACCGGSEDVRDDFTAAVADASAGATTGAWSADGGAPSVGVAADAGTIATPPTAGGATGVVHDGGALDASGGALSGGAVDAGASVDASGGVGGADAQAGRPQEEEPVGMAEDRGADCPIPDLPAANQLAAYAKHHDPFLNLDGSRITKKAQWRCRRAQIKAQVEAYEAGPKPTVAPRDVSATWSAGTLSIKVQKDGKSTQFSIKIDRPSDAGSDPIPLSIAFKFATLDASVFSQNHVATVIFDNDALGAESGGSSRGTGVFYNLYGKDHPASSIVAWAWGVSRILDALEKTPEAKIDPTRVAVTGCSRYGKGALLAGALDERIALTIPQESGAGGSASWRVSQAQSTQGVNVQTLTSAANEQPWFRASFGSTFGGNNVTKLPFDHHMVMGLVAPRPMLVIDNAIDWLGIDSSFTAASIAHAIWEAFGLDDHMGYWQSTGHTHCEFPVQQRAILDAYVKRFLVGGTSGDTKVLRGDSAKADLKAWMDWTPPTLE